MIFDILGVYIVREASKTEVVKGNHLGSRPEKPPLQQSPIFIYVKRLNGRSERI